MGKSAYPKIVLKLVLNWSKSYQSLQIMGHLIFENPDEKSCDKFHFFVQHPVIFGLGLAFFIFTPDLRENENLYGKTLAGHIPKFHFSKKSVIRDLEIYWYLLVPWIYFIFNLEVLSKNSL